MQVILIEQVKNVGKIGDVVTVKGGFARNFLIPSNKALRASKANLAQFEARKKELEKENAKRVEIASKRSKKIEKAISVLIRQAGEDGRLYGSVKAQDIAAALNDVTKDPIERTQIVLHKPIKYIGVHTVQVELHPEVIIDIYVNVARSDADAEIARKKFERGEVVMEGDGAPSKSALDLIEVPLVDSEAGTEEAATEGDAAESEATEGAEGLDKPKKKSRKKAEDKTDGDSKQPGLFE